MNKHILIIIIILIYISCLFSDTNFRVMSYNALNFDGADRLTYFETVLTASAPDILICQEIESASASDAILTILNSAFGGYARANFVSDGNLNNMLFYKTSIAALVSQNVIDTSPRDISEYVLNIDGNPIRFYSCHLKASTGYEADRLAAVTILRDHLNGLVEGTEFIIVGDMNFYTSSEDGYQKFIADEVIDIGRAENLCTEVGSWHDSGTYADVHTQSTRTSDLGDGGATGGMDDKFDFIFGNYGINNGSGIEYSTSSFTSYGNDGNHFNISINDGTNSAVPSNVADALYYASDHLPVYADFVSLSGTSPSGFVIISEYIEGSSFNKAIEIYNGTGAAVDLSAYSLEKDVDGNETWGNTYNFTGTLADGDVYVMANSAADPAILGVADATDNGVINFNGDDQVRLLKYGAEIDRIGIPGNIDFAKDVTYVRESTVTEPLSGSQDPRSNGEWDEYPIDTFSYLGSHTAINPTVTVVLPNGSESWERGNLYDITWSSSDFSGDVKIELFKNSTSTYSELFASTVNDGLWEWNIPIEQSIASDYKIKISDASDGNPFDESDDYFSITGTSLVTDLFISEYMEGSGNNKAIEIFNGTGAPVDLGNYQIVRANNGAVWAGGTRFIYPAGTMIADGDVWVNVNADEALGMSAVADSIGGALTYFNGDDSIGLFKVGADTVLIDVIGENGVDPGSYWPVAGESNGTQEHTLVRKSTITAGNTDWDSSAGTNATNSEWVVYPQDTWNDLGSHTMGGNVSPLIVNVVRNPAGDILTTTTVSVSADVTDSDGTISLVELHWGLTSGNLTNTIYMSTSERATYTTDSDIPAQIVGTTIYYEVYAEDDISESSVSAELDYSVVEASSNTLPYFEPFDTDLGLCYVYNNSGATKEWYWNSGGFTTMNGYNSGDTEEDWLILPAVDFDSYSDEVMTFDTWYNYGSDDLTNYLKLVYSSDYPGLGDPTGYTWTELTFTRPEASSTWTPSGNIYLSTIIGTSVYVAFKYHYEVGNYRWWEIDNISINGDGTLDAPTNIVITHDGSNVTITWDAVAGAASYIIYISDDPYAANPWTIATGTFDLTTDPNHPTWTETATTGAKKFYKVTAE